MLLDDNKDMSFKQEKDDTGLRNSAGSEWPNNENKLFAIPQSDITVNICKGIMKLRHAEVDKYINYRAYVDLENKSNDVMHFEVDASDKFITKLIGADEVLEVIKNIRASQIQLFQYILYKCNQQSGSEININIQEFLSLRNINRRQENVERVLQDIAILSCIKMDLNASYKGQTSRENGNLLVIKGINYYGRSDIVCERLKNSKIKFIAVELGSWYEKVKLKQFAFVEESFFRYNSKTDWVAISLSIKLGQLLRTNNKTIFKNGYRNCKLKTLINHLSIEESDIIKQGHKHYYEIFLRAFNTLIKEGYKINIDKLENYKTTEDFINCNIKFSNEILINEYKAIKRIVPKKKKNNVSE